MKKLAAFIFALSLCATSSPGFAASGCTYPGTLDSYVDKLAGDFLTIADVNNRSCAIEKLETGPLRPNDGSAAAPAYAFRSAASSGMYYVPATPSLAFTIGATTVGAIVKIGAAVNYITLLASATANVTQIVPAGTDTNIGMMLNTKGTGSLLFDVGGNYKGSIDSSGRLLWGHVVATSAGAGDIVLSNNTSLRSVTVAGTDSARIVGMNTSNQVVIGGSGAADIQWGTPLVANGGGAAPTFGTIGGSGPTLASQHAWLRVIDSTGTASWVPVWH